VYPNESALNPNVEFFYGNTYLEKATRVEVVPEAIHGGLKLLAAIELARKFRARQKPVGQLRKVRNSNDVIQPKGYND